MKMKNHYYDQRKAHHNAQGFQNIEPFSVSISDVKKWKRERRVNPPREGYTHFEQTWWQPANFNCLDDAIWWLGHASTLIQINQRTILTDPIFSKRASPVAFAGPKRYTPSACQIEDLPHIDVIAISHNHYDHLDHASIKKLIKRFPHVTVVVPLGLKNKLQRWGANEVIELDWWQSVDINGMLLTSMPARHWSRRGLFDTNRTLWCGWMIEFAKRCVYFVGDTSYTTQFKLIPQHFAHIDVALIPIGSYAPRWFMHNQHVDPAQALQLFNDIGCKRAMAIHWGTFELADEPLDEPPQLLQHLFAQYHVSPQDFSVLKIGQSILLD
ncbi:MBL fold metallo-hydrolase [Orbus sasakiae]|uniref:MBL fold metallo-hydrolase n=2 Tax=Orbus sasakiae TaxID=1078475 RepID=A0ABP9N8N7_9GAMM